MSKIYRPHNFNNPYFQAKKQRKTSRFYYSLIILGVVIFCWVYFLFCSSIFKIKYWEISGLEKYSESSIEGVLTNFLSEKKFIFFSFSNIFTFNKNNLENYLYGQFVFEEINIQKQYPNKLIITLKEKEEALALYNNNDLYILAEDATITSKYKGIGGWDDSIATSTEAGIDTEKIITDYLSRELTPQLIFCDAYNNPDTLEVGDTYPETKIIKIIKRFDTQLNNNMSIKVKLVALTKNKINQKITVLTNNGWQIYLNDEEDGATQFQKFFLIYNNEIKDINKPLEYIDLRFGDRIYVK